jgi:branched-chain amino acid transport system permease protein
MPFDNTPIHWGSLVVTPYQGLILLTAFIMMALLYVFIKYTRTGKAMRAVSEKPTIARLMGIDTNKIIRLTFIWGSALGAVAGILVSLDYKVYPTLGGLIGLKAFIAAVVGGIGNVSGAMLGGILLGVLETYGVAVLGIPVGYKDAVAFGLLIIVLLLRPSGILGNHKREKV